MQNAPKEHSAILLTFIKLPIVFKTFVLSVFEWLLKTGFTVFICTDFHNVKFRYLWHMQKSLQLTRILAYVAGL